MAVDGDHPHKPGYELKLNSYDLSVDIELADAIQRLRFEHPEVQVRRRSRPTSTACSARARTSTCSGSRPHSFKVNFCKFTNETAALPRGRVSANSGLALARRVQGHDGRRRLRARARVRRDRCSSTTAAPPCQLPRDAAPRRAAGHRRPHAPRRQAQGAPRSRRRVLHDAEGIKGKRAKDWGLVDHARVAHEVGRGRRRAREGARREADRHARSRPCSCSPLEPKITAGGSAYKFVELDRRRRARAPARSSSRASRRRVDAFDGASRAVGAARVPRARRRAAPPALRLPREQRRHRAHQRQRRAVQACDEALAKASSTGFAREVRLLQRRVLKRYDNTARSFYAVADTAD